MFDFNASLNDVAPLSAILLTVDLMRKKKDLLMHVFCVCFWYSPFIPSSVSVMFDFNTSLNDVAPVSPVLLTVDLMRIGKEWIDDECHLCVVSFVFTF